jgi:hypothetical protein
MTTEMKTPGVYRFKDLPEIPKKYLIMMEKKYRQGYLHAFVNFASAKNSERLYERMVDWANNGKYLDKEPPPS